MKVITEGLVGVELVRRAFMVSGASPAGTVRVAVQVQGNLYEIVPPGRGVPAISRMESLSGAEATKITASGYDCAMFGPVGALGGPLPPDAGKGGGHEE